MEEIITVHLQRHVLTVDRHREVVAGSGARDLAGSASRARSSVVGEYEDVIDAFGTLVVGVVLDTPTSGIGIVAPISSPVIAGAGSFATTAQGLVTAKSPVHLPKDQPI
jgi:hypothetical protein